MIALKELIALSIFISYFALIILLFNVILGSLRWPALKSAAKEAPFTKSLLWVFVALTAISFGHTWFYMFKFLHWSFTTFEESLPISRTGLTERVTAWLMGTELFEQAWAAVCSHPLNWWWSEQLCIFTVGFWTVFLTTEGTVSHVKHLWAYMLLGQLVAISVASNLFYLALLTAPRISQKHKTASKGTASPVVWLSVTFALLTVALSPFTSDRTFLPNLLTMHTLIVLPLVARKFSTTFPRFHLSTESLSRAIILTATVLRARTTYAVVVSLDPQDPGFVGVASSLWHTLHSHPAQASIGWDVVWTTISFLAWVSISGHTEATNRSKSYSLGVAISTFVLSVGVVSPLFLM